MKISKVGFKFDGTIMLFNLCCELAMSGRLLAITLAGALKSGLHTDSYSADTSLSLRVAHAVLGNLILVNDCCDYFSYSESDIVPDVLKLFRCFALFVIIAVL